MVMPLTEDCGIVEWVPHTTGLRHCCQAAYIAEGLYAGQKTNAAIKKVYDNYPVRHIDLAPCTVMRCRCVCPRALLYYRVCGLLSLASYS